jgi:pimeloyl-ACP methyl ester carboxylesterase
MAVLHQCTQGLAQNPELAEKQAICLHKRDICSAASRGPSRNRRGSRREADVVFGEPCEFDRWPDVPIHVIAGRDDRLFPLDFQRRIARERLHLAVDALEGGHLIALSNPHGLVSQLFGYL